MLWVNEAERDAMSACSSRIGSDAHIGLLTLLSIFAAIAAAKSQEPAARQTHWSVIAAGAKGDGLTDDTVAFQAALKSAARGGGGTVEVPAGRYRIDGNLEIPEDVTLQGTFKVPPVPHRSTRGDLTGSTLLAYAGRGKPDGPPFIRLAGHNASTVGLIIAYPEWKQTDVPPVPYPPCILAQDVENTAVQECCLLNPYEGIKLVRAPRHLIRNVTGYPIKRGIYVDECYDIGHIENIHFWPFGVNYQPDNPYCRWINTQGVAFELARTDWHYVFNTFCFGYGVGYKFSESKAGSTNGNFLGLGADSCQRAVVVDQAQPPGLLITNGEFVGRWSSTDAVTVEIGPKVTGKVSLVNCSFWGPIDQCVWMRAPEGQFTASACHFVNWDVRGRGAPALKIDAGRAIVTGCTFQQEGPHVQSGPGVKSVILTSNQASGGFLAENSAGSRTQIFANEAPPPAMSIQDLKNYRVIVGAEGDGRYLRGFFGRERAAASSTTGGKPAFKTMRWSGANSRLILPVAPGVPCTVAIDADVPPLALSSDAGLYLNGKRVGTLKVGAMTLTAGIPPTRAEQITLEIRCRGWVPRQYNKGSQDDRTLGIQVFRVSVTAEGRVALRR
jgi:hypothetical protein